MNSEQRIWLVKSSGRILGPYSLNEMAQLLKEKEVLSIDEVSEPFRRWQLIRDHELFQPLLTDFGADEHTRRNESTVSSSITGSVTENLQSSFNDEITEDISEYQSQLKEIVYDSIVEDPKPHRTPDVASQFQAMDRINFQTIKIEAEKNNRWLWVFTILIVSCIGMLITFKKMYSHNALITQKSDPAMMGLDAVNQGNYTSAQSLLQTAYNEDNNRTDLWLPLAMVLLQDEGKTVEAKRLLQKVIDSNLELPWAWTGMALANIKDKDLETAQANLNQALLKNSHFLPAQANLGSVALLSKNYTLAIDLFKKVIDQGFSDGALIIELISSYIGLANEQGDKKFLTLAEQEAQSFLNKSLDYQQELQFTIVYLSYLKGTLKNVDQEIRKILNIDPDQTQDFVHSLYFHRGPAEWSLLGSWCHQLVENIPDQPSSVALKALCFYKEGQTTSAKVEIEKSINQSPRDPLLQALYASLLKSAGYGGEASVALGRAIELDRANEYSLPKLLQAKFCEDREDYECANIYWLKLLEDERIQPIANVGMSLIYLNKNLKEESLRFLNQSTSTLGSNYKPYLKIAQLIKP
ncbi:MAG: tetratricopeptide repeat protein [Bdellovibrionales bacterium]|nr:tetratricopeptide repeat protein [Bdellovibrionales bacterium]